MLPGLAAAPLLRTPTAPRITWVSPNDGSSQWVSVGGTSEPGLWIDLYRYSGSWSYVSGVTADGAGNWSIGDIQLPAGNNSFIAYAYQGSHCSPGSVQFGARYVAPGEQWFGVGTSDYAIPLNNYVTVELWGSGGGGAGVWWPAYDTSLEPNQQSTNGGNATCDIAGQAELWASGGGRGENAHIMNMGDYSYVLHYEADGWNGGAGNGDVNGTGWGGAGGGGQSSLAVGGEYHRGGNGGWGGYAKKTYWGLPAGTNLHIVVGGHGIRAVNWVDIGGQWIPAGGYFADYDGADGSAKVSWG